MSTPTTSWMTIEEFDALPQRDDCTLELHEGELVEVTFPAWLHRKLQERIKALLQDVVSGGEVMWEAGFQIGTARPTKRSAGVAFISAERAKAALKAGVLEGAPELIVEVLSPSNTPSQINRYARLGFEYGTQQFWSVDPETQTIPVRMPDGNEAEYRLGDSIPLPEFMGGGMLHVSDVFEVGA